MEDICKQITILNLLNHSSGIPDAKMDLIRWVHHDGEPSVNQTEMIEKALPKYSKLIFEPGSQTRYTNVGYMVLAAIVEKVSGQSFETYVNQNILRPLGMNRTGFAYTQEMAKDEAAGSHPFYNGITLLLPIVSGSYIRESYKKHVWFERFYNNQQAPSGLIGPVSDMALLIKAYINKGEINGSRILTEESVNKMSYSGLIWKNGEDTSSYVKKGIAWLVIRSQERLSVSHTGGGLGFNTCLKIYPEEKIGIVVFTNDTRNTASKIADLASTLKW